MYNPRKRHLRSKILVAYLIIILPVYSILNFNERYKNICGLALSSECSNEIRSQVKVTNFVQELIYDRLSHCYIIQIRNENFRFDQHFRDVPTIDVDLRTQASNKMFVEFNMMTKRFLIRFQEQCIVYYVIFVQSSENNVELHRLTKVFTHPKLLSQAHQSYIFISDYENKYQIHDGAKNILIHRALKNYEHKTWIEVFQDIEHPKVSSSNGDKYDEIQTEAEAQVQMTYQINNFCYFCKNGQEGVLTTQERLRKSSDVQHLLQIFPDVTSNLWGRALHVTAAMALPFVGILASKKNPKELRIEGMQGTILHGIAQAMNFTFILENTSGGLTGSKLPNGTWTGTIGEILYGRSDVGLNAATSADRHEYVDFTVSAFYGFLVLVSTKPLPFFEWKAIFYPFEIMAWLGICASTVITILAYRFFLNNKVALKVKSIRRRDEEIKHNANGKIKTESKKKRKKDKVSFLKVCYITFGSLLEQGIPFEYSSTPASIFAVFWLMFTIVATCAYKSKLFMYLTFPTIKTPPSTFHELSVSDYSWGLKSLGGVAFLFIKNSPVSYIRDVGDRMEISMDKYSCIDKTFSKKFVCIIYRAYYDYMSAVRYWKISHKFHVSDYVTPPVGSAWVLPKYSPLLHPLDKFTFAQFEMGLAGIYLEHYIKTMALKSRALALSSNNTNDLFMANSKFKRETLREKPLEFVNLYAGFLLLFFGTGISATALFVEIWRHKGRQQPTYGFSKQWRRVKTINGLHLMRPKVKQKKVRFRSTPEASIISISLTVR